MLFWTESFWVVLVDDTLLGLPNGIMVLARLVWSGKEIDSKAKGIG